MGLLGSLVVSFSLYAQEPVDLAEPNPLPASSEGPLLTASRPEPPWDLYARDSYRIDSVICPFRGSISYKPGEIECFLLQVPENREKADSRFIELHVVKLSSRWGREDQDEEKPDEDEIDYGLAPGKRDDPVVYLTGGPGAKVGYYVERFKDHTLLDHRDLYILEQRGIGWSGDFCPFYSTRSPARGDADSFDEYLAAGDEVLRDCIVNAQAAGVDVTGYNTIENARDVKALRRALGFEKWNVWGISYGSILGQAYVKEDPEGILALAIDAIMPLNIRASDEYWRVVKWYQRDLTKLQEICDTQPRCKELYPDISGRLRQAVSSMNGQAIVVDTPDTEVFPSGKARFFPDLAAFLPFSAFYEQDNYPGLPGLIYAWADIIESRDETVFQALAVALGAGDDDASNGMHHAILCLDGHASQQVAAFRRDLADHPVFATAITNDADLDRAEGLCDELGIPSRPSSDYLATETDIPSLIIEGDMDPITPPPNARAILPGFSNGTYVEFPYAGHGPSRSVKCAGHMLNAFYDDPAVEPDLRCVEEMEIPEIYAPIYVSSIAPKLMALYGEGKKKLILPAAWLLFSVITVLVAFIVLTWAPIGRWFDKQLVFGSRKARVFGWLAATVSVAAIGLMGVAIAQTAKASELLVLFGFVPMAHYGAWLGVLAGVLGLISIFTTISSGRGDGLGFTTYLGLLLTGLGALGISSFMLYWGLLPSLAIMSLF
jgi:pimeloyl-ACP methyl ester carboxylesterase